MQLSILSFDQVKETHVIDVAKTDFAAVAKTIAAKGFMISQPNPPGGTIAAWHPAVVIRRIETLVVP
jgi:hypothetical protein